MSTPRFPYVNIVKEPVSPICGKFHQAVELIGGRWTGAVIQTLLRGPTRYADIRSAIPEISDRMLSDRLRILESEGLVERRVVPETPVRVEYRLTEKGRSLDSALAAIGAWAEQWIGVSGEPPPQPPVAEPRASPTIGSDGRGISGKPRIKPKAEA